MPNNGFSQNFADLESEHPERIFPLFRYKVANYKNPRKKILNVPNYETILVLKDKTQINVLLDQYALQTLQEQTGSSQDIGSQSTEPNPTKVVLAQDLLPPDYEQELYVFTEQEFEEDKFIRNANLMLAKLGSTHLPSLQTHFFSEEKNKEQKLKNIYTLTSAKLSITPSGLPIGVIHSDNFSHLSGVDPLEIQTDGMLGELDTLETFNGASHQLKYELDISKKRYALIQAQTTKLAPSLNMEANTFSTELNLEFDVAKLFILPKNNYLSLKRLFVGFQNELVRDGSAVHQLYKAMLTILFLAQEATTKFKDFRITDTTSQNFQKIDITKLSNLYGISTADDIGNLSQKEITTLIFKTWEQEFAKDLNNIDGLSQLLKNAKIAIGMLGHLCPSEKSYGSYDSINKLAYNYYFESEGKIPLSIATSNGDYNVRLDSFRYELDINNKSFQNIKTIWTKAEANKTFQIDGEVTLNLPPEQLVKVNMPIRPSAIDPSTTNFLNYFYMFEIPDATTYAAIMGIDNLLQLKPGEKKLSSKIIHSSTPILGIVDEGGSVAGPETDKFISENYVTDGRKLATGSIQNEIILLDKQITRSGGTCIRWDSGGYNGWRKCAEFSPVVTSTNYQYTVIWYEELDPKGQQPDPIKTPYNLSLGSWSNYQTAIGIGYSTFIYKPITLFGDNSVKIHALTKVGLKIPFASFVNIKTKLVKTDGTKIDITIGLDINNDQTIIQRGFII